MATLSLAMIVKDEEARLGHCLDSVRGLVDEMIVMDTGSSDGTCALASSKGAKVVQIPWQDDFSQARNKGLAACSGDWVLVLDADEAIDAADHAHLRQAIGQEAVSAYRLVLRNYYQGGGETVQGVAAQVNTSTYSEGSHFSHYSDGKSVRLCRRYPDLQFQGRIHEVLEPYFQARGLRVLDSGIVIHHFGKADRQREAGKKAYYLELAQRSVQEHPDDPTRQFHLLQQAMAAEAWPTVLEAAQSCLRLTGSQGVHPLVFLGAAMALQFVGRHGEALPYLDQLLVREASHAQGLTRRAVSLAALGRLDEARAYLRLAIQAQPGFIVPYVNLAELESQCGEYPAARASLEEGLRVNPRDPQLLHARVQLEISHGDLDQAVQDAWAAVRQCPTGGQGAWHRLIAFSLLQKGAQAQAVEVLEMGLSAFPGQEDLLRLRALAR